MSYLQRRRNFFEAQETHSFPSIYYKLRALSHSICNSTMRLFLFSLSLSQQLLLLLFIRTTTHTRAQTQPPIHSPGTLSSEQNQQSPSTTTPLLLATSSSPPPSTPNPTTAFIPTPVPYYIHTSTVSEILNGTVYYLTYTDLVYGTYHVPYVAPSSSSSITMSSTSSSSTSSCAVGKDGNGNENGATCTVSSKIFFPFYFLVRERSIRREKRQSATLSTLMPTPGKVPLAALHPCRTRPE